MRAPVIVASTWSSRQAELIAAHLGSQGIAAFTKPHLDPTTYGTEMGGAAVFVDADQRLEAELELVLLSESRPLTDPEGRSTVDPRTVALRDSGSPDRVGEAADEGGDDDGRRMRPPWVRAASWLALGAIVTGTVVPAAVVVWHGVAG